MATSEEARHALYSRLDEVLGHEHATTLMNSIPPGGWGNVATKDDIAHLHAVLRTEIQALEHRLEGNFYRELGSNLRTIVFANMAFMATAVSLTFVAVRL